MIPRIIHYCWFGSTPIPETEIKCIESWKRYFPDYELMFWNEQTFNFNNAALFAKQALESRQYAFVSDYVRVKVLYEYGGIYFDTDYEIIKPINDLLYNGNNILGWENSKKLGTAFMAFKAKDPFIGQFLEYYQNHYFIDEKGRFDITANVSILTDILCFAGLKLDRTQQKIGSTIIYPREYFFPKRLENNTFYITAETYGIHHVSMSWLTQRQKNRGHNKIWLNLMRPILQKGREFGIKIIGKERIRKIEIIIRNFLR